MPVIYWLLTILASQFVGELLAWRYLPRSGPSMASSAINSGALVTLQELNSASPHFKQGASLRVTGRWVIDCFTPSTSVKSRDSNVFVHVSLSFCYRCKVVSDIWKTVAKSTDSPQRYSMCSFECYVREVKNENNKKKDKMDTLWSWNAILDSMNWFYNYVYRDNRSSVLHFYCNLRTLTYLIFPSGCKSIQLRMQLR